MNRSGCVVLIYVANVVPIIRKVDCTLLLHNSYRIRLHISLSSKISHAPAKSVSASENAVPRECLSGFLERPVGLLEVCPAE